MILIPDKNFYIAEKLNDGTGDLNVYDKRKIGLVRRHSYDSVPNKVDLVETDNLILYDIKDLERISKNYSIDMIELINKLILFGFEDGDSGKSPIFIG